MRVVLAALAVTLLTSTQGSAPAEPLRRVAVIGASFSDGFGTGHSFAQALGASLRSAPEAPIDLGDVLFFTSPLAIGSRQMEAVLQAEPSLVVAIDFLFWFGYGTLDVHGGPIEREAQRLELLERGLSLLEELECPLVVGDFPDMSAAIGKMLAPAQVPDKATLPLLSRRVAEWAAARKDTLVLPLAELVAKLRSKQEFKLGRHTFAAGTRLLQSDELHPTLEGLAATAQLVCDELVRKKLVREEDCVLGLDEVMERLEGEMVGK